MGNLLTGGRCLRNGGGGGGCPSLHGLERRKTSTSSNTVGHTGSRGHIIHLHARFPRGLLRVPRNCVLKKEVNPNKFFPASLTLIRGSPQP